MMSYKPPWAISRRLVVFSVFIFGIATTHQSTYNFVFSILNNRDNAVTYNDGLSSSNAEIVEGKQDKDVYESNRTTNEEVGELLSDIKADAYREWNVSQIPVTFPRPKRPEAVKDGGFPPNPLPVQVFYNVFLKSEGDAERVGIIMDEQLSFIDPELHNSSVLITSIGTLLTNISRQATIRDHQDEGDEGLTLHAVWEYCRERPIPEAKVVYLHSKGSFHDNAGNRKLRPFLTKGALSKECANLPESCNVCSSRMSPIPHAHTPGNMWLARCDYIAQLIDPYSLQEGKLPSEFTRNDPCRGFGRFFFEHWVHSHPDVKPCDLYSGRDYLWGSQNVPGVNVPGADFVPELRMAPRFELNTYDFATTGCTKKKGYERNMRWNYEKLYNLTPGEHWWGLKVFDHAG